MLIKKTCNEAILHKVQKNPILGNFWPEFAILHLCAKNEKRLMSQSREKLVTDARTNGRTDERTNIG